ncbi:Crp/Fnr family transcriptional regulator [Sediminibacterium roseum]|uniref:Crp/Fnr family transcriptional regulator n=1 Tax=Sediminibacterium roseum TaxID=1978412 RepID=A0ABW9ZYF0_9BACT|nr:Crp/Fnr family transcriptional regulator [Sediminibacterium roseum]NCI51322.1 Crp/Fnr family transcriptional regulator [Sediminibacterium roseum]
MDELFQYLDSLHPLSDELKAALVGRVHRESFRKNRPLLSVGDAGDWIAFVEKGFAKLCYDIPGGYERIICFLRAGEMIGRGSYPAVPSRLAIVALDETVIWKISRRDAEWIAEKHSSFHVHLRRITEIQSAQLEMHYLLQALPARERLAKLPKLCEWMLKDKRIKQYMIADYLGVDRATVSRWNGGKFRSGID